MNDYLLVAKGNRKTWDAMTESDFKPVMDRFGAWIKGLTEKGLWIRGGRASVRKTGISAKPGNGFEVIDGPFPATQETLTGFFLFRAENMAQAVELAKGCPALLHDSLELHEIEQS